MNHAVLYVGSVLISIWGVARIVPTKNVVAGFGPISTASKRLITQTWISEGLTLWSIGLLVLLITVLGGSSNSLSINLYRISALMLVILAVITLLTGARTSILTMKICRVVKMVVAILFFVGGGL